MSEYPCVISEHSLIDLIEDNDIDGFKGVLAEDDTHYFDAPETFYTESEALAFCADIGHGTVERAPVECYPLQRTHRSPVHRDH